MRTKERSPFGKLRDRGSFATVSELAELAVKFRDQGSFGTVGELASGEPAEPVELADINCARVKDTAWILKAKNGTPHTRS